MTNDQRITGFKEGLAKHPNLKLVAEQSSNSDPNTALSFVTQQNINDPEVQAILQPSCENPPA